MQSVTSPTETHLCLLATQSDAERISHHALLLRYSHLLSTSVIAKQN